jgi:hypothetical protein
VGKLRFVAIGALLGFISHAGFGVAGIAVATVAGLFLLWSIWTKAP